MNSMNGHMFQFSSRDKNLLGFMSLNSDSKPCTNAVVFIAGQTDGFLSLNYTPSLGQRLVEVDYSLIQVSLSSSFLQFGFKSLWSDIKDLTELVAHIKEKYQFKKLVFLGSSTGCQDTLYFLRHSLLSRQVNAVILQGAVSDRDYITTLPETPAMLKQAEELKQSKLGEQCLAQRYFEAPITANRFLSLATRFGTDDMFSLDFSEEDLVPFLSSVKVPITLCFSAQDEYVPDLEGQKVWAQRMVRVLKMVSPNVECKYFNGDHMLEKEEHYRPFVDYVVKFVSSSLV